MTLQAQAKPRQDIPFLSPSFLTCDRLISLVDAQRACINKQFDHQSKAAKRVAWWELAARSDRVSNLMMAWQSQLSQLQPAEAQSQLTPQWQIGPQVEEFSLCGHAQVWSQVQALGWSLAVI